MSRSLVPVVLLAVVLAGCVGGFGAGPSESATSTARTLAPSEAALPPGVSESGVTNATALAAAHDETLRAEGFALNGTFVRTPSNAGNLTRHYETVVAPDATRFRSDVQMVNYATDAADSPVRQRTLTRVWGNATATLRHATVNNRTAVSRVDDLPPALSLTRAPQYESYLRIGTFEIERVVARDGHTVTTLVATGTSNDVADDVSLDATFVVDERGVVHEATVTLDSGPDRPTDRAEYRVVRLGASPQRPDWVADALGE